MSDKPVPNLFIIGAMKSGTTSLHEYLNEHPDVFMSDVKEPGYFSDCVDYYPKDDEWYESLFKDAKHHKIIGESSTHYTKLPICDGVIQKIWKYNPDARFIYIMRNPITRIISHYWHGIKYGDERHNILTAIKKNKAYVDFSDYAFQLEPYIERFGKDKIYTLSFESLVNNPTTELKKLFEWLGVDAGISIKSAGQSHNALPDSFKRVKGFGLLYKFRQSFIWNTIAPFIPKKITSATAALTVKDAVKSSNKDEGVHRYLKPIFTSKVKKLEALLNKKFDEWHL
ncbi:putative deacetylase sulfotransferase [hydrothermal vent metagenome]|uniref:Putative deacetylase sulfotransferase n=1 Tax=hydrothermal vent metagenome TaxID=652676 RepID=A0A3B0WHI7_9ZZZZ